MLSNLDTNGLVLFGIGMLLRFVIGRRRFNRKNLAGLQVFSSYLASQLIPVLDLQFSGTGIDLPWRGDDAGMRMLFY